MFRLLFLLLIFSSLAAETEKSTELYSKALQSMGKKEYALAQKKFRELQQHELSPEIREEIELQMIEADIGLKNYKGARSQIGALFQKQLFPFMSFRTHMLLARVEFEEQHINEAFWILQSQEKVCPLKDWPLQDRILYTTIQLLKGK